MLLKLNSQDYAVTPRGIRRRKKDVFAPVFAQTGGQIQQAITAYDTRTFGPWIHGIGRSAIPVKSERDSIDYQMFQDSECDTRWVTGVYPGLLLVAVADTGLERVWAYADYKGKLEAMWTNTDSPEDIMCVEYDSATPDWHAVDGGDDIDTNGGAESFMGLDLRQYKEKLVALFMNNTGGGSHLVRHSTDTVTWTVAATPITSGLATGPITTNLEFDGGKLEEIGAELVAAVYHQDNGTITFFSSTDAAVWSDELIDIVSAGGVKGFAKIRASDNTNHGILGTREGLWDVVTSPATWTFSNIDSNITSHPDSCRNMVNHNGELWYPQGVSTSDVFQVWRMFLGANGQWIHEPTAGSPHLRDGLPTDMLGTVTAMFSSGGFCYIVVGGGAAGRKATVFCHNGFGWHPISQSATENRIFHTMAVSAENDGVVRLHLGEKVGTDDSEPKVVENVNSHPSSGVTIARNAASILALPFMDGGMPTTNAIWMMMRAKVDALDTDLNGEHIPVTYGKDGEARTANTDLDNDVTDDATHDPNDLYSNAKELDFTTTAKQGVQSVSLGLQLTMTVVTPATPELQAVELVYIKDPPIIQEWDYEVDVAETHRITGVSPEVIVTNLESAESNGVLVPLTYGQLGTKYVSVTNVKYDLEFENAGAEMEFASAQTWDLRTGGTILITVSQVVT